MADAGVHVAGEVDVADGPAVNAALVVLKLTDELAGADLRRAGERSSGEHGLNGVKRVAVIANLAAHGGADVHHVGVALDGVQLFDLHRARIC